MEDFFEKYIDAVKEVEPIKHCGTIVSVRDLFVESIGPQARLGEVCQIASDDGSEPILAEVVGMRDNRVQLMSYSDLQGVGPGRTVIASGQVLSVGVGQELLGRVLNAFGKPIDNKPPPYVQTLYPVLGAPPSPLERTPITNRMITGVRAVDSLLAVGQGQRLGIFSGSGVGKSTLLGMIARNTKADVNVIALIGERGREVMDFIKHDLGPDGLSRSVVITSTSDTSPLARIRGAYTATAIAEYFRDQGKHVMLLFDSVTRFAKALREVGLTAGEKPATRGYPASVFAALPRLLERGGTARHGSITGFYSVLVDGDDMDEPVSDAVRGILDGHIVLSRDLARRVHYPAIDVLDSISRLAKRVSGSETHRAAARMRRLLTTYTKSEDMILVGAYQKGTNAELDEAIERYPFIQEFLMQEVNDPAPIEQTLERLGDITGIPIPADEAHSLGVGATKKFAPRTRIVSNDGDSIEVRQ